MAIRSAPNYTFEHAHHIPFQEHDADVALSINHPNLLSCSSWAVDLHGELCKLKKHPFPPERDKSGKHALFLDLDPSVQQKYLLGRFPSKPTHASQHDILKEIYKTGKTICDTKAVYAIMSMSASWPVSVQSISTRELLMHIESYVSPMMYAMGEKVNLQPTYDVLQLLLPVISCWLFFNQMSLRMGGYKQVKKINEFVRDNNEAFKEFDPFLRVRIEQDMRMATFRSSAYIKLAYALAIEKADDFMLDLASPFGRLSIYDVLEKYDQLEDAALSINATREQEETFHNFVKDVIEKTQQLKKAKHMELSMAYTSTPHGARIWYDNNAMFIVTSNKKLIFLTAHMISECIELLGEIIMNTNIVSHHFGFSKARDYFATMYNTYDYALSSSYDTCNFLTCLQREFELACITAHVEGRLTTFDPTLYGYSNHITSIWRKFTDGTNTYQTAKFLRPLRQFAFEPTTLMYEQVDNYRLARKVDKDSMAELQSGINFLFARHYVKATQKLPQGMLEKDYFKLPSNSETFLNELKAPISAFGGIKWGGCGKSYWVEDDFGIKDSTNVPDDFQLFDKPGTWKDVPLEQKREILFYAKKDPKVDYEYGISSLVNGVKRLVRLTVKPEQKEAGRTITMENCRSRRINTIAQNNIAAIPSTYWGSLMNKSIDSKLKAVSKLLEFRQDALNNGQRVCFIMTDFKKFGHSIPVEVTEAISKTAADYFGQDWLNHFGNLVRNAAISASYDGLDFNFMNDIASDGQGMRNFMWQTYLTAIPFTYFPKIKQQLEWLGKDSQCEVVFFQDDHVIAFSFDANGGKDEIDDVRERGALLLEELSKIYNNLGLWLQPQKSAISHHCFGLLGDAFDEHGIIHAPHKGLGSMLKQKELASYNLRDIVNDFSSAVTSNTMAGIHPLKAWERGILGLGLHISNFLRNSSAHLLQEVVASTFTPSSFGGPACPLPHNVIIGLTTKREQDLLYLMYQHVSIESFWASTIAGIIHVHEHEKLVAPKNKLLKQVIGLASAVGFNDLNTEIKLTNKQLRDYMAFFSFVPSIMKQYLKNLTPVADKIATVMKVMKSSTIRSLMKKAEIKRIQSAEVSAQATLCIKIRGAATNDLRATKDKLTAKLFSYQKDNMLKSAIPTAFVLLPCDDGDIVDKQYVRVQSYHNAPVHRILSFGNPASTIVDVYPIKPKGVISRAVQMHEFLFTLQGIRGKVFQDIVTATERLCDLKHSPGKIIGFGNPVMFRDVPGLQISPPAVIPWSRVEKMSVNVFHSDINESKSVESDYVNYNVIYTLAHYLCHGEKDKLYLIQQNIFWNQDDFTYETVKQPKFEKEEPWFYAILQNIQKNKSGIRYSAEEFDRTERNMRKLLEESFYIKNQMYKEEITPKGEEFFVEDEPPGLANMDVLEAIAADDKALASKVLFQTWCNGIYTSLARSGVNVRKSLRELPPSLGKWATASDEKFATLAPLLPRQSDVNALDYYAKRLGVYTELLNFFKRIWVSMYGPTLPIQSDSISQFTMKWVTSCPSSYIKQLRFFGVSVMTDYFKPEDRAVRKRFLLTWADNYKFKFKQAKEVITMLKSLPKQEIRMIEAYKLYVATYRMLAMFFYILAKETTFSDDEITESIEMAAQITCDTFYGMMFKKRFKNIKGEVDTKEYLGKISSFHVSFMKKPFNEMVSRYKLLLMDLKKETDVVVSNQTAIIENIDADTIDWLRKGIERKVKLTALDKDAIMSLIQSENAFQYHAPVIKSVPHSEKAYEVSREKARQIRKERLTKRHKDVAVLRKNVTDEEIERVIGTVFKEKSVSEIEIMPDFDLPKLSQETLDANRNPPLPPPVKQTKTADVPSEQAKKEKIEPTEGVKVKPIKEQESKIVVEQKAAVEPIKESKQEVTTQPQIDENKKDPQQMKNENTATQVVEAKAQTPVEAPVKSAFQLRKEAAEAARRKKMLALEGSLLDDI